MKSPRPLLLLLGLVVLNGRAEPRRLALVIGNASYEQSPLPNPGNDADLIAETLQKAGFSVSKHKNLRLGEMKEAIKTFSRQLDNNSVVAFFYAGHGIQYEGKNYLLPIGALEDIIGPKLLDDSAIRTDYLLGALETSPTRFLFLDSCRDNPFPWAVHRGWNSRGLAPISNSRGTLISYAAAANSIAVDSSNSSNSPYSRSLAHWLAQPVEIEKALKQVAIEVEAATQNRQNPSYDNMLRGDFYFTKPAAGGSASTPPVASSGTAGGSGATSEDTEALLKEADAAYGRGDYARTREILEPLAEAGHARSQYNLGLLYDEGQGVKQDYAQAREWYEKAAAAGNADAQGNLGYLYQHGHGVKQDYAKAREWYEKAVAQGHASAQVNLGYLYEHGHGVKQDYAKAREWYEKAAAAGNADAQVNLGVLYDKGQGVKQDHAKARELYEKAAAQGLAAAQYNLGFLYNEGQGVKQDYAKAREWYEKAAAQDYASAQHNLGVLYILGQGVQKDYAEARRWFEKAAAQGDEDAQEALRKLKNKN